MKRFTKKLYVCLCMLLSLVMVVSLVACGGGAEDNESGKAGSTGKEPTKTTKQTISFWNGFGGSDRATLESLVAKYNEIQEEYYIDMEIMDWELVYQKLATSAASNEGPDFICFGPENIATYANMGAIVPINDFYEKDFIDQSLFPDLFERLIYYKDDYIGIPMNFFSHALFYNKDIAEASGLDPESPPTTWDELAEWAETMTNEADGQYGLYTPVDWVSLVQYTWANDADIMDYDTKTSTINEPEFVEAVDFVASLFKKGVSPALGTDGGQMFTAGKLGMLVDGPWQSPQVKEAGINYGLVQMPAGPKRKVTFGAGLSFHLTAKGSKDEAVKDGFYDFAQYWFSIDTQKQWASEIGFPPVRTDLSDDAELLKTNPDLGIFMENSKIAQPWFVGIVNSQKILSDVTNKYFEEIFVGDADTQTALDQADTALQTILDTEK